MMVRRKRQFIGFGFDPGESAHHFAVIIPEKEDDPVTIDERFEWNDELDFSLTVSRARGAETRASIESLFENVENVVPQNIMISLDRSISK
jgi:hypothetical protein